MKKNDDMTEIFHPIFVDSATSYRGHKAVVRLLLDKGVHVNAQGGLLGNALQAASACGYEAVVRLLLDRELLAYVPPTRPCFPIGRSIAACPRVSFLQVTASRP
jgi:hypothetical protein